VERGRLAGHLNGDFSATYTITMVNVGGSSTIYDLSDTPTPDTNITVNGASVSGYAVLSFTNAGPYTLATAEPIGAGSNHVYTLTLDLTLQSQVLAGASFVTTCGEGSGTPTAGEGLFNSVTATYGTNDTTVTTNDCGDIPPFILIDKTFVSAPSRTSRVTSARPITSRWSMSAVRSAPTTCPTPRRPTPTSRSTAHRSPARPPTPSSVSDRTRWLRVLRSRLARPTPTP
jgi:hypothetical protein